MATLAHTADRALDSLQSYQLLHVNMAAAAEMVADLVAERLFTPAEATEALADFVRQYRKALARLDGRARA